MSLVLWVCCALVGCKKETDEVKKVFVVQEPRKLNYEIVATYPHDTSAFTQGLILHNGVYYESTGGYGTSTLRKVDSKSGDILQEKRLPSRFFGEGLALVEDKLFQLEWKSGRGFIYDLETFDHVGNFRYRGEGWGLTTDGKHLILSNGSHTLHFFEAKTFKFVRSLDVRDHLGIVEFLNELEYIEGKIYANIWFRDEIVVINPETGIVEASLNLSNLERPRPNESDAVLNGIAYDPEKKLLHVTGKRWPKMYVLKITE